MKLITFSVFDVEFIRGDDIQHYENPHMQLV